MITTQEDISPMMRGQRTLFACPLCDAKNVVFVTPSQVCSSCGQRIPDIFKLMKDDEYRQDYYMGVLATLSAIG